MGSSTISMRGGRTRRFKAEINVVPYIDVMLVLLVIFMVAAPLASPSVVDLPNAGKAKMAPTRYIEIVLKADNQYTIGVGGAEGGNSGKTEKLSSRSAVMSSLRALRTDDNDLPLMISADKNIKYDEVIQMISDAKKNGVVRVGLATR